MGPGDREFLIHPSFGAAVKTALQPSAVSEAASRTLSKKPFDWLLDEQYSYLQVSALRFQRHLGTRNLVSKRIQEIRESFAFPVSLRQEADYLHH